jgi:signal transduction histidine kinase
MRRRLVLAIAGVAAGAVVLFAVPLGIVLGHSYRDRELLRLQRDTVAATRQIDVAANGDPVELPPTRDVLGVYDRSLRRVAGRGPAAGDDLVRAALRTGKPVDRSADGRLLAAVPLVVRERVTGAVRAVRGDGPVVRSSRDAWVALAGLSAALVLAAVAAALVLGRRLARPLERLAAAARRLGEGEFTVRAPRTAIPELDAVASALDATARRLDELLAREREFSANASHQLRTPLAALRIELEGIELRGAGPAELPAALAQVERLQATVDTLLSVARDTPRADARTDLARLLEDVRARWHGALAADGRPLRVVERAARPVAASAGGVVSEILDVLVSNAHRHGAGAVSLTVRDVEGGLAVDVADEGPGFDGDPELAFARRGAGATAGGAGGHGIGLALARSLAESEGGRLAVTRPGPGPVLTLLLARAPRDAAPS